MTVIVILVILFIFCVVMHLHNKSVCKHTQQPVHKKTESIKKQIVTYNQYTDSIHSNKFHFTVAGTYYRGFHEKKIAKNLCNGDILFLEEEPNNPYDSDAIMVISNEEYAHIGYVPREYCIDVKNIIRQSPDYDVEVTNIRMGVDTPFIDAIIKY